MTFINYAALIFTISQLENTNREMNVVNCQNTFANQYTNQNHKVICSRSKLVLQPNNNRKNRANHYIGQPQWRGYSH